MWNGLDDSLSMPTRFSIRPGLREKLTPLNSGARLFSRGCRSERDVHDQLFNSSEKRLARTLLLRARYGKEDQPTSDFATPGGYTHPHGFPLDFSDFRRASCDHWKALLACSSACLECSCPVW